MSGRGRGRRAKKEEPVANVIVTEQSAPVVNEVAVVEKPKAARGGRKKQFPVVAVITQKVYLWASEKNEGKFSIKFY